MKHICPNNLTHGDIICASIRGKLVLRSNNDNNLIVGYVVDSNKLSQQCGTPLIKIICFNSTNDQYISADDVSWEIDQDELEEIFK
jgi:hypothetical protein